MILRDPVHGLIAFEAPEDDLVVRLLECNEVQRLRRIRQLGLTSLAYPGAEHTRFAHALGTAHVMKRLIARLRDIHHQLPPEHRLGPERAREAQAAALLHDVGHGPFSHLFEDAIPGALHHEVWSTRIITSKTSEVYKVLAAEDASLPGRVADLVNGRHELTYLARAVSGTLDVDRCDYLLRDAHSTGVSYGEYDLDWLLRSLTFAPHDGTSRAPPLAIDGAKGIVSVESFILARLFMFQQVYFHKATRAAEWMIRTILARVRLLLQDEVDVPSVPRAVAQAVRGGEVSLKDYLALDDGVFWGAVHCWEESRDGVLSDLCRRFRSRSLFKTLELYDSTPGGRSDAVATASDIALRAGMLPEAYIGLDVAEDTPFSDAEDPLTVVFPNGTTRKPAEVSFLLGRLRGETVVRTRLIFPAELRESITRALS